MNTPKSYIEIINSIRHMYMMDPKINSIMEHRVQMAYPKFRLGCRDIKELDFYTRCMFRVDLPEFILKLGLSAQMIGEGIVYGLKGGGNHLAQELPEHPINPSIYPVVWDELIILDSALIETKRSSLSLHGDEPTSFFLRPSMDVKTFALAYGKNLDPQILKIIRDSKMLPLDRELVSILAHKSSDFDLRGLPNWPWEKAWESISEDKPVVVSEIENFSPEKYTAARKKERKAMEEWMMNSFFKPLASWNNLRYLPEITWQEQSPGEENA